MAKMNEIYRCDLCGNIVELLHVGAGELVCCGQPMVVLAEKTADEGQEKHLPVVEKVDGDTRIKIGATPHPMEEKHYIEWVEVKTRQGKIGKKFLVPGDETQIDFHTREDVIEVRSYCNIHGLWKTEVK